MNFNTTPVQPVYSKSGLLHLGTPTGAEILGFPAVTLECSGKTVAAIRFTSYKGFDSVQCKRCKKIVADASAAQARMFANND